MCATRPLTGRPKQKNRSIGSQQEGKLTATTVLECDTCKKHIVREWGQSPEGWVMCSLISVRPLSWFNGKDFCSTECFWQSVDVWREKAMTNA